MPTGHYKRKPFTKERLENMSKSQKGKPKSKISCARMSKAHLGVKLSAEHRKSIGLALKGKPKPPVTQQHKNNLSKSHKGNKPSIDTKRRMRVAQLDRVVRLGGFWCGLNETKLLDNQEKIDNCKIQRSYHIKYLGYIVDGYCPETNTVYEVYEKAHDKEVFSDLDRENEICKHLSCDFIIINDRTH